MGQVNLPRSTVGQPERPRRYSLVPESLRARLHRVFVLAVGVLVIMGVISTLSILHLIDARHSLLGEIDPASLSADQLLVAYVDQETGIRGYVLSNNVAFLQPTIQGAAAQKIQTRQLGQTLARRPDLLHLAQQAETQATKWQHVFAQPAVVATAAGNNAYASTAALTAVSGSLMAFAPASRLWMVPCHRRAQADNTIQPPSSSSRPSFSAPSLSSWLGCRCSARFEGGSSSRWRARGPIPAGWRWAGWPIASR